MNLYLGVILDEGNSIFFIKDSGHQILAHKTKKLVVLTLPIWPG
jgi:hypothetical protein